MSAPLKPESIPALLAELVRARFWGSVQIDYQDGRPILIRKTETQKVALESSVKGNTHDSPRR
jgi:hypothetical protein